MTSPEKSKRLPPLRCTAKTTRWAFIARYDNCDPWELVVVNAATRGVARELAAAFFKEESKQTGDYASWSLTDAPLSPLNYDNALVELGAVR